MLRGVCSLPIIVLLWIVSYFVRVCIFCCIFGIASELIVVWLIYIFLCCLNLVQIVLFAVVVVIVVVVVVWWWRKVLKSKILNHCLTSLLSTVQSLLLSDCQASSRFLGNW